MRLNEIFDTKISDRKLSKEFDNEKLNKNSVNRLNDPHIHSGAFGYVKSDQDPFLVKKRPHFTNDDLSNDAYYTYIKTIVDDKLAQSNPYFPRIYDIKIFKDSTDKKLYSIKLEKLFELEDISTEELKILLNKCFKNLNELIEDYYKVNEFDGDFIHDERGDLFNIIDGNIIDIKKLKDDNLKKVISLIQKIVKDNNGKFHWDLHSGNLMVRRTAKGSQLVIVDPLASD